MQLGQLSCCGIKEITGLSGWPTDRESFYHMLNLYSGLFPCAWICFNGVRSQGYVAEFAAFLEENKLGPIVTLPHAVNPNSSNMLDVRMWQVDRSALQTWHRAHGPCLCHTCEVAKQAAKATLENQITLAAQAAARNAAAVYTGPILTSNSPF